METKIKPSFLQDPVVQQLFSFFADAKAELYVVGGAVRDALKGKSVGDLDFATNLSPKAILSLFVKHKVRAIPTGGAHGTVTVVMDGRSFEITPYRSDVETDGRHAKVDFVPSMKEDAFRRDFTMNALYMDSKGQVYDFVDGLKDLKANVVRFIGHADKRIQEDYLRILRFFRFSGQFSNALDPAGFAACIKNRDGLKTLSRERILDEMLKIMRVPNLLLVMRSMVNSGIFGRIFKSRPLLKGGLKRLITAEKTPDVFRRLFFMVPDVADYLPIPNVEKRRFKILKKLLIQLPSVYEILYYYGKAIAEDFVLVAEAKEKSISFSLKDVEEVSALLPPFPVHGEDLMRRGFKGPAIGQEMKRLEKKWLDSQCLLSQEELLNES